MAAVMRFMAGGLMVLAFCAAFSLLSVLLCFAATLLWMLAERIEHE